MNNFSMNQVTFSVTDIKRSFDFYKNMGLIPIVKSEHYARFILPGNEATFSIHIADSVKSTTTIYFEVDDVDKTYSDLTSKGFAFTLEPVNQRWQWREAYLNDPDGNIICIYHAGIKRINPEWRLDENKDKHFLTKELFEEWLQKYKAAWENESPENAADLFTEDAIYYETPFDEPSVGKDKIVKYWNAVPDEQKQIKFGYEIIHTYDNIGYCKWSASFIRKTTEVKVMLNGIFEVSFDKNGKGRIFKEWWHRKETN